MLIVHEDKAKLGRLLRSQEPREGDASNITTTDADARFLKALTVTHPR
jgi:hypothetical protein